MWTIFKVFFEFIRIMPLSCFEVFGAARHVGS